MIRFSTASGRRCPHLRCVPHCLVLLLGGCGALNPAFVSLVDPSGAAGFTTVDNAPGHVIITFLNNATVDERLLAYLESAEGGGLSLSDGEKRALRPRIRMRVRITFTDGSFLILEFIDGSSNLVAPNFDAQSLSDLNENTLDTVVVLCDVASVQIEPGSAIDVFVPVELKAYELVETTTGFGAVDREFQLRESIPPQFRVLQVDEVDSDGNVTARQNIGARDVPSATFNPLCGSVVAIVVDGVLSVPFLDGVDNDPSFDRDDPNTAGTIGGRYEFIVNVR